jgi:methyl-accepting chemotaxis protein
VTNTFIEDLSARKDFIGLDAAAEADLRKLKAVIDSEMPEALEAFYAKLLKEPAVARFFTTPEQVKRAKNAQRSHWSQIATGSIDQNYVDRVSRSGLTHARIGLEPRWYIGGYAIIADRLIKSIMRDLWPKSRFRTANTAACDEAASMISSFVRTVLLDMDLAIAVYFQASEKARIETEQRAAADAAAQRKREEDVARARAADDAVANADRTMVVEKIGAALEALASQDLTTFLAGELPGAYKKLQDDFNSAVRRLDEALLLISSSTQTIETGTREIAAASDDLARRTEQQAAALEQSIATVRSITETISRTSASSDMAAKAVAAARVDADQSGKIVAEAVGAMGRIEHSSQEIGQIISVIDEIAFQTNLLALNAGVEAARAGEAGRGFAVVAAEVRALAQRAADAAKQIKTLVGTSSDEVAGGVRLVSEAGSALMRIVEQINEISGTVSRIAATAREEADSIQQINVALGEVDKATQQNAAMAEEASAAGRTLAIESERLSELIGQFQLSSDTGFSLRAELKKVAPHAFGKTAQAAPAQSDRVTNLRAANGQNRTEKETWDDF